MSLLRACIALVLTVPLLAQIAPEDLLKLNLPLPDHRIAYGPGPQQFGELRLPKTKGPHPVAVVIHGGCFSETLPGVDPRATSLDYMRPLAIALTNAGVATWNIEFRRAGSVGGGWPNTFLDLGHAVDHLRTIARQYQLDLKRVSVLGHSSGGELALWVAARPRIPKSSALFLEDPLPTIAAINIDGPFDLAATQPLENNFCPVPGIVNLLGGTPAQQPERYRDGSPQSFLPLGVPQILVEGGLMAMAPTLSAGYRKAAAEKGEVVRVVSLPGSGHFDMLDPALPAAKQMLDSLVAVALSRPK